MKGVGGMGSGTGATEDTRNDHQANIQADMAIATGQPLHEQLAQAIQPTLAVVMRQMSQIADEQATQALEPIYAMIWQQVDALIGQVRATMWTEMERTIAEVRGALREHIDGLVEPANASLRREVDDALRPLTASGADDGPSETKEAKEAKDTGVRSDDQPEDTGDGQTDRRAEHAIGKQPEAKTGARSSRSASPPDGHTGHTAKARSRPKKETKK